MADKNKKPEIRFQGYTDDWEQRKLGDIARNTYGGGTPKTSIEKYWSGEFPWIQSSDLILDSFESITPSKFITSEAINNSATKIVPKNSIAIVTRVGVGKLAFIPFDYSTSQDFLSLSNLKTDGYFSLYSIYKILKKEINNLQGTSIKGITKADLLDKVISIPKSLEEQTKIGDFFKQLDDTIALHQRKLEKTKNMKKAMLDKMFPKEGKSIPEIRFTGFTEDWELCKLGEVSDIVGGGTPSTTIPEYWNGEIDWYSPAEIGEQIYVTNSVKKITALGLEKSSARILPIGTVLFTSRAGIGNTAILAKESCTNQGFQSIVPHKDSLDSYFIFSRTHELKRYGEVTGAGSTFVEVSGKQMAKMPLRIPSLEEQQKIGNFFKQIDDTIALHQSELQKLKNIKNSLLEKMFV